MIGIYRDVLQPDRIVKVITRDDNGISYEDRGSIVFTRRIRKFDERFRKDEAATTAAIFAELGSDLRQ